MIRLDRAVSVSSSPDDTFAYIADFANVESWDPGVIESRQISPGPVGVGTEYDVVARFMGARAPMRYRVVRWDAPTQVELHGRASTLAAVDRISFEPDGDGGTRVRYEAEFTFRRGLGVADKLLRRVFERVGDNAMRGLTAAPIPAGAGR